MSKTYIPVAERRFVRERALFRCEYCIIHEDDAAFRHEIDHIISEKHGGETVIGNLAYACFTCNNNKGSDLASLSHSGIITRLFNPRTDDRSQHFQIIGEEILPLTAVGEATMRILDFNARVRKEERRGLQSLGRYPVSAKE